MDITPGHKLPPHFENTVVNIVITYWFKRITSARSSALQQRSGGKVLLKCRLHNDVAATTVLPLMEDFTNVGKAHSRF